jgi:hypothetical protein
MPDLAAKKSDYISAALSFAEQLLALTRTGEELALYQTANALQSGGASALVDADCTGTNAHVTAATVNAVVTIAGQLGGAVTTAMRNTMRQASHKPTP